MIKARNTFQRLSEYPHRAVGSEEEMMAREELSAILAGEVGVDTVEEAFYTPANNIVFIWTLFTSLICILWFAPYAPSWSFIGSLALFISYFLYLDNRYSPMLWINSKRTTANLVSKKGNSGSDDDKLIIIMAYLDSPIASFAHRAHHLDYLKKGKLWCLSIAGFASFMPFLMMFGLSIPTVLLQLLSVAMIFIMIISAIDFWMDGYCQGGNGNLSGVAAATELASKLWRDMPDEKIEIRLVITSAHGTGMLGAQHYARTHLDELKSKDVYLLNLDCVGDGNLFYITDTIGVFDFKYDNILINSARSLPKLDKRFSEVKAAKPHVGDFDSIYFAREGMNALTLTSLGKAGRRTRYRTKEDKCHLVDKELMEQSVQYGEMIIRSIM